MKTHTFSCCRISITCACPMHLSLFPLDQQTCTLDIASCESFVLSTVIQSTVRMNHQSSNQCNAIKIKIDILASIQDIVQNEFY